MIEGKYYCIGCNQYIEQIKFKRDKEKDFLYCRRCRKKMKVTEPRKTRLRN